MKPEKDYYQTLGVSPQATSPEIRRAYRRLAILNHPDKNPSVQATLRMQEINEAYGILGDKRKRSGYDSERGIPFAKPRTTSAPRATPARANLQQIFAEDIIRPIGLLPLTIAKAVLIVSTIIVASSIWWISLLETDKYYDWEWDWRVVIFASSILVLSLISIGGIFFLRLSKSREMETQCPKCGKARAAEKLDERLAGVSRYKIHYRCKYCSYEWQFIKTKKRSAV